MYQLSYYPWLTQGPSPQEIDQNIRVFAAATANALKARGAQVTEINVNPPVDVPKQIQDIVAGTVQISLMNPLGFAFARKRSDSVEAVVAAKRVIDGAVGVTYFSQIYARKDSAIASLADCRGKGVGYGLPYSTSNFLMAAQLLYQAGVHPLLGFETVRFLGNHDKVALAVYNKEICVGAGHDGVIKDLASKPGYEDAKDLLVQVARSPAIPSDPVVLNISDASERGLVQQALIDASATPEGAAALEVFWGRAKGLAPTNSGVYMSLLQALSALKLDERDVLPAK